MHLQSIAAKNICKERELIQNRAFLRTGAPPTEPKVIKQNCAFSQGTLNWPPLRMLMSLSVRMLRIVVTSVNQNIQSEYFDWFDPLVQPNWARINFGRRFRAFHPTATAVILFYRP